MLRQLLVRLSEFSPRSWYWGICPKHPQHCRTAVCRPSCVYNNTGIAGGVYTPTIPDGALGYEIDAGFDWKLLEGMTARCTAGYWVPGNWWSYACADKSLNSWGYYTLNTGSGWGTIPGKHIDPVFGMEFKLEGNF